MNFVINTLQEPLLHFGPVSAIWMMTLHKYRFQKTTPQDQPVSIYYSMP